MVTIVAVATPGTFLASLGTILDAHARLGEGFVTNLALGAYATSETRLALASTDGGDILLCGGRRLREDDRLGNLREARMVFLPSFMAPDPERALDLVRSAIPFHDWLRGMRGNGAIIAACGASVLHLAVAGLVDGLECSVPPRFRQLFAAEFSQVVVAPGEPITAAGGLFTCSRDADNAALVLRLLGEGISPTVARSLAQRERPAGVEPLAFDPLVASAQLWIRDHFASDFRIADLAADIGTSHQALIRRFRDAGQATPRAYVQQLRVEAAAVSLVETGRSVAEVAQLVGYSDIPSFRRVFTAHTGMTPAQWRRRERTRRSGNQAAP